MLQLLRQLAAQVMANASLKAEQLQVQESLLLLASHACLAYIKAAMRLLFSTAAYMWPWQHRLEAVHCWRGVVWACQVQHCRPVVVALLTLSHELPTR
jgi:hypothetical protein